MNQPFPSVTHIASSVRAGSVTALEAVEDSLSRIADRDGQLGCFTRVFANQARADATRLDQEIAEGAAPGPLAGVPFAVKDLFDVKGVTTTAGAKLRANAAAATADAEVVARLRAAGAILVGTVNMDEFAYGFVTVNAHYGTTCNPHDPTRLAGGSSGGSAAAVAAGLVPFALGSDTNGSVRVPASLCGVFGMRPTFGSVSTTGVFPFVERLDTVGAFTRSAEDLALVHGVLADVASAPQASPNVARLGGFFRDGLAAEVLEACDRVAAAFGETPITDFPLANATRSAAFLITSAAGGALHVPTLRERAADYDPATCDRLIAGALLNDAIIKDANALAERATAQLDALLETHDILLAPATPTTAPRIDQTSITLNGEPANARANLGMLTQPFGPSGVPVLTVPTTSTDSGLPIGVQLIAKRGDDARLFSAARMLEEAGAARAPRPPQLAEAS